MKNEAGKLHSTLRRVLAAAAALALLLAGTGAASAPTETALPEGTEAESTPPPAEESPPPAETEPVPEDGTEPAAPPGETDPAGEAPEQEEAEEAPALYAEGKIYIYTYSQLLAVGTDVPLTDGDRSGETFGTGAPVTDENGLPVTYAPDGAYVLMNDIPFPEGERWTLEESFAGRFENGAAPDEAGEAEAPPTVYDPETDSVYLYNPWQLRAAGDETGEIPVTAADYDEEAAGTGELFYPAGEEAGCLTYGPALTYILSAAFAVPEGEAPPAEEPEPEPEEAEPLPEPEPEPEPEEEPLPEPEPEPEAPEPEAEDVANITIRSVWKDLNDAVGVRPDSAELTLYRTLVDENGDPVDETGQPVAEAVPEAVPEDELLPSNPVVLTAADRAENALWQTVIEDLPAGVTDETGQVVALYAYSVEEAAIDGYNTTVDAFTGERDGPDGATSYEYVFTLTASASPMLAAEDGTSALPYTGGAGSIGIVCFGAGLTLLGFGLRRNREDGEEEERWPEDWPEEDELYD